ncbi:hypothetical protein NQ318_020659 [Aromia moschata]|uniref:Protein SMG9 n=1 Tax=Aromia moschata TaxID=1265417 RepID=A0AAV8X853_9CUCU|nr:hypothetical protein NQ318_020659 [Aromia moschata]
MSDYDRSKFYPRKKNYSTRDSSTPFGRGLVGTGKSDSSKFGKESSKENSSTNNETIVKKQPTILIKTREPTGEDVAASPKRSQKEDASTNITIAPSPKESDVNPTPSIKSMTKSAKLIDEGVICTESLQDYVQENSDFLVVGVVGAQGVGKSTILNLLSHNQVTEDLKRSIFKSFKKDVDDDLGDNIKILTDHFDKIDVILLDCQAFMSVSILDDLVQSENKRTNLVSEFIPLENSGEIQSLQLTAFLMFIHSAEMLKPTISNPEDELIDNFPHLLLVHNRAQMEDFSPARFKIMQQTYKMLFQKTKLNVKSNLGLGSGRIINYLSKENCGSPINLFLIPEVNPDNNDIYNGYPPLEELIKRLRAIIMGATKNPLTHVQLTEKTWLVYCSKVWDTVKKSSFFVEYTKLMP